MIRQKLAIKDLKEKVFVFEYLRFCTGYLNTGLQKRCDLPNTRNDTLEPS